MSVRPVPVSDLQADGDERTLGRVGAEGLVQHGSRERLTARERPAERVGDVVLAGTQEIEDRFTVLLCSVSSVTGAPDTRVISLRRSARTG